MKAIIGLLMVFILIGSVLGYTLPATTFKGNVDMYGYNLSNLTTPVSDSDAVTKAYADALTATGMLALTGGEMLGQIDFGGFIGYNSTTPVNATDLATKGYVDGEKIYIDFRDFGGVADGITDDTQAWNDCINASADGWDWPGDDNRLYSHSNFTIKLPAGNINLTPGETLKPTCDIEGPGTTLQAHTAGDGALLHLENVAFLNIELKGLHGYYLPYTSETATSYMQTGQYKGTGLQMSGQCVYNNLKFNQIVGFEYGQYIGDADSSAHIASNNIFTDVLQHNQYGRYVTAHTLAVENNYFKEIYAIGNNVTCYYYSPKNNSGAVVDNVNDIGVVESVSGQANLYKYVGENVSNNKVVSSRFMPCGNTDILTAVDSTSGYPHDNSFIIDGSNTALSVSIAGDGNKIIYRHGKGNYVTATNTAETSIAGSSGTQVPFANEITDDLNQWDGQAFTAQSSGVYVVDGLVTLSSYANTPGSALYGYIEVNDVPKFTTVFIETNATSTVSLAFSSSVWLDVGDKIEFLIWKSSSGNVALTSNGQYNWMSILQV